MNGVLFKPDMVRATLDDRKTQTRRVMKPQPTLQEAHNCPYHTTDKNGVLIARKPKYHVGEIVYVKEAWCRNDQSGEMTTYYRVDMVDDNVWRGFWKSPLFMPAKFARIFLKITAVRCERLQDISEEDAYAEGIDTEGDDYLMAEHYLIGGSPVDGGCPAIFAYKALWEFINGPGSWAANPWVWVYGFERVDK